MLVKICPSKKNNSVTVCPLRPLLLKEKKMDNNSFYRTISGDHVWHCKQVGERISEHLFTFENDKKYGVIDEHFNYIIPPDYDNIILAFKNHLWVFRNKKWSLINFKEEVICSSFADISEFKGQYACVSIDGKNYGFINRKGEMVISTKYLKGTYIGAHLFAVPKVRKISKSTICIFNSRKEILKYGVIDLNENLVHPYEFDKIPGLQEVYNYIIGKKRTLYQWLLGKK